MSSNLLSVVIPVLDDPDIIKTIASIRETAGPDPQIIIVNDSSAVDCHWNFCRQWANVEIVNNRQRCGSGPSRHIGALYASGEWLLHTDSHMRFEKGWYEAFKQRIYLSAIENLCDWLDDRKTVFCGTMIALDEQLAHRGEYSGATLNLVGPDPGDSSKTQVFEENWLKGPVADGQDLPCIMGACYFVNREWYLNLSPHRHLRSWGKEEVMLALKTWLSGGSVHMLKSVRVGHIFRGPKESPPYEIPSAHLLYNKLFAMWTLLPFDLIEKLLPKLAKTVPRQTWLNAAELIQQDWHLIAAERAESRFTMTFAEYCQKFSIALP